MLPFLLVILFLSLYLSQSLSLSKSLSISLSLSYNPNIGISSLSSPSHISSPFFLPLSLLLHHNIYLYSKQILYQRYKQRNTVNVYQTPLPFFTTQIINPFLNSMILAMIMGGKVIHCEILLCLIVPLVKNCFFIFISLS